MGIVLVASTLHNVHCHIILIHQYKDYNGTTMSTVIQTDTLTNLFQFSVRYHRRKLREIFRQHYKPFNTEVWTKHLSQQVIDDLRLHLSWDLGIRTFTWSREVVGTRILYKFKELGILLFMKKVILDDQQP